MYSTKLFVVPTGAITVDVIIGHELLKEVDVFISGGNISIKRRSSQKTTLQSFSSEDGETLRLKDKNEQMIDNQYRELSAINCVEIDEIDAREPYKSRIEELIDNYSPASNVKTAVETKIVLRADIPISQPPRRLSPKEKKILADQIDEWTRSGIIQSSSSDYASPVVIVPKKDRTYRVCIDYRQLNKRVIRDRFPMPLIDDCLDSLAGARVFSVIDLKNGFFHVPVAEDSRKYTSFITPDGQYEFLKTPFGLCNSPASFLRFVDEVFRDLIKRKIVYTYMDDLIVPGVNEEDAFVKLKETLDVAARHGLVINWKKCQFMKNQVEFLGHVVEGGRISPSPAKVKAVQSFPTPKTKRHIQMFLGLTGYFRKFIKNYALIARPLSDLLKNDRDFQFDEEQTHSFLELKKALQNEPVLRIYNPDAITELHTDASKDGFGAVLLQKLPGEAHFHPVHFMSLKTSDAEKKCHSYELEVLAVVKAIRKYRVYLLGVKFKLVTDCAAFEKTLSKKDLPPKIARWAIELEEFEYEKEHRPAQRMKHVDALSRFPVMIIEDKLIAMIRKKQEEEEKLNVIRQLLQIAPYEDYLLEDGILKKRLGEKCVVVLPSSMQTDIIRKVHENGHFGVQKMAEQIQQEFYIPKLREKLNDFVSCCISCHLAEKKRGKKEGFLRPIPKGDAPLQTYHADHLGPITATSKLYKYLFVVVDGFTKFAWLYPTKTTNAAEVINRLVLQQKTFGSPSRVVTDKGSAFTSMEFKNYCEQESIEHVMVTTGVPRGNGQVERVNRTIIPVLTKLSAEDPSKWFKHVDKLQRSLNSTYQASIGMTPFEALIGTKMRHQNDTAIIALLEEEATILYDQDREDLRKFAKQNLLRAQEESRKQYNKKCKSARQYNEGDLVAIRRTQFGPSLKIQPKYFGPYRVIRVKGNDRYEVMREYDGEGPRVTTTAADYMKNFCGTSSEAEDKSGLAGCKGPKERPWNRTEGRLRPLAEKERNGQSRRLSSRE